MLNKGNSLIMVHESPYFKDKTRTALVFLLLVTLPQYLAGQAPDIELHQLPPPDKAALAKVPKNVARWHMGTTLTRVADGTTIEPQTADTFSEGALLADNETRTLDLPVGRTEYVMELAEFHKLSHAFLASNGAVGTISLAAADVALAPDSGEWLPLGSPTPFDPANPASLEFPVTEAKYVRITFDISEPGAVGNFTLQGTTSVAETPFNAEQYDIDQVKNLKEEETVAFDFASLHAGSSVSHVSGGDLGGAQAMIDDDTETAFTFPTSVNDAVMIQLNQTSLLDEISVLMDSGPGTLKLYTFTALPEGLDAGEGGVVTLPGGFFEENPPRHEFTFDSPTDRTSVQLVGVEARYVMLQWEGATDAPFTVSEISVNGPVPRDWRPVGYNEEFQFATPPPGADIPTAPTINAEVPQIPPNSE